MIPIKQKDLELMNTFSISRYVCSNYLPIPDQLFTEDKSYFVFQLSFLTFYYLCRFNDLKCLYWSEMLVSQVSFILIWSNFSLANVNISSALLNMATLHCQIGNQFFTIFHELLGV
jgi:hypothetical protein